MNLHKIYANENFPLPVVNHLKKIGHDVLTTHDTGKSELRIPDDEVLEFAISENRIMLTLNRIDFIKLHRKNQNHFGIIVCTEDADFERLAKRIHESIQSTGNLKNQLIRINRPNLG